MPCRLILSRTLNAILLGKNSRIFKLFSLDEKEHQIMQLLKPYLHKTGTYVIWYWSLAKRPTICVVAEQGRILTFVVHRSVKNPPLFYVSKEQETSSSLKELSSTI